MNIAIINLRDLIKYIFKIIFLIALLFCLVKIVYGTQDNILKKININVNTSKCLKQGTVILSSFEEEKTQYKVKNIMDLQLAIFTTLEDRKPTNIELTEVTNKQENVPIQNIEEQVEPTIIGTAETTEIVAEKNLAESYNTEYTNVKINNKSDYTITAEMLVPDVTINNPKNILIYHTHTCESYTPSENYNYTMTGNYRTTDSNYNMIRVGKELETYLTQKGFNVIHDGTYHDYPAYSGSYDRSYQTATNLLYGKDIDLVFDIHRDAIGSGDTYGPTVKINGERVAQLMFVVGTNGGGLEHPNWIENFKIAIKIQAKANEMYPGLFRPMILTNSRYNQHIARGASIIEVGATANTLEECLLSMQCLANVLEEVCNE